MKYLMMLMLIPVVLKAQTEKRFTFDFSGGYIYPFATGNYNNSMYISAQRSSGGSDFSFTVNYKSKLSLGLGIYVFDFQPDATKINNIYKVTPTAHQYYIESESGDMENAITVVGLETGYLFHHNRLIISPVILLGFAQFKINYYYGYIIKDAGANSYTSYYYQGSDNYPATLTIIPSINFKYPLFKPGERPRCCFYKKIGLLASVSYYNFPIKSYIHAKAQDWLGNTLLNNDVQINCRTNYITLLGGLYWEF